MLVTRLCNRRQLQLFSMVDFRIKRQNKERIFPCCLRKKRTEKRKMLGPEISINNVCLCKRDSQRGIRVARMLLQRKMAFLLKHSLVKKIFRKTNILFI